MKNCAICGKPMPDDGRRRYCAECARRRMLENKADWARNFRRQQRALNKDARERVVTQAEEIDQLKSIVSRQRRRIRQLCAELRAIKGV